MDANNGPPPSGPDISIRHSFDVKVQAMTSQETRSMRIFAMATMGLLLAGIALLAAPTIGGWAIVLGALAAILLLRSVVLAITLDRPGDDEVGLPDPYSDPR